MLFNYDWWFGADYARRTQEAKRRCAVNHFARLEPSRPASEEVLAEFMGQLEARTIVYLRDGFSYEMKEPIDLKTTASLTFECTPADDTYKVGAFVITIPFEEIVRIEVFAFHPQEKPEEMAAIKGFASAQAATIPAKRLEERPLRRDAVEEVP
ncbi:MAG TPA: hypothetical protein VJZ71_12005 [Phycisphaerae bacterium]|nr:hypothetical protein [Phycisphaerae bacterium]